MAWFWESTAAQSAAICAPLSIIFTYAMYRIYLGRYPGAPRRSVVLLAVADGVGSLTFCVPTVLIMSGLNGWADKIIVLVMLSVYGALCRLSGQLTAELKPFARKAPSPDDWGARMDSEVKGRSRG